jgi:hypothetical protein
VLTTPFPPMLAALERKLPMGTQWLYEPKLDGFLGMLRRARAVTSSCSVETSAIWRPLSLSLYKQPVLCRLARCSTAKSSSRMRMAMQKRLENSLPGLHPCLQVVAQTHVLALAHQWLALLPSLEGVVAKRADGRYSPGRRDCVKVKRQRTGGLRRHWPGGQ